MVESSFLLYGSTIIFHLQLHDSPDMKKKKREKKGWYSGMFVTHVAAEATMFIFFCHCETDSVITYAGTIAASSSPAQPSTTDFHGGNLQWHRQAKLWIGDEAGGWPRASPPSFCLSRCYTEAQGTSLGDERIYLSVTELAERMKWIWLGTGRAGLVKHLNICTRLESESRYTERDGSVCNRCPEQSCKIEWRQQCLWY